MTNMETALPVPTSLGSAQNWGLNRTEVDSIMESIYARGDRLSGRFILGHVVLSIFLAPFYQTWVITAVWGGISALVFFLSAFLFPRTFFTRAMAGVVLESFCALHIWQMHGQPEQHFWFFIGFTMMIVYQDWLCMWPGALLIIVQHTVFAYFHNQGVNLHFFPEDRVSGVKLFFHFGIAIAHVAVCGYWALLLKHQTLSDSAQKAQLVRSRHAIDEQLRVTLASETNLRETAARLRATDEELRRDIIAREQVERALRESQRQLRDTLEVARMVSWELDPASGRLTLTDQASALLGWGDQPAPVDWAGLLERLPEEDRTAVETTLREAIESGTPFRFTFRIPQPEGEPRWLSSQGQRINQNGRVRVLGMFADITERVRAGERHRKLELKVQQAQKLESLGVLAGGIAHDFNNLLTVVIGNVGLLREIIPPEASAQETAGHIETAALRAADLTRQMLAYSGGGRFLISTVSLSDVVREMGTLLGSAFSKNAELRYQLAEGAPAVEADRSQIGQVVMNLITNAADALGGAPGVITIATGTMTVDRDWLAQAQVGEDAAPGDYLFLRVADTGCGMTPETLGKIFDPFFTTKFTGRGLGLAAVLGIVRGHEGAIRVETAPGRGSTFTVLFPPSSTSAAPVEPRPVESVAGWRGTGTVLVIDDESGVSLVTRRILEGQGLTVLVAADGAEGLRLFRQHADQISLVLVDKTMPGMNGLEVATELFKQRPELPVVLASGYDESSSLERTASYQLAAFLQKPFVANELIGIVRELLDRKTEADRA
jgi:PAS domain S-box-containing protein